MKSICFITSWLLALWAFPASGTPVTVFSDDFQDEVSAAKPALTTTPTGANGDVGDLGTSWTYGSLPSVGFALAGMSSHALNLGFGTGAFANANFNPTGLEGTVVTFDLYADYTSAGSQTANIYGYSGANLLFNLQVVRGQAAPKWRINNLTATGSPVPVTGDNVSILRTVTATLHATTFDLLFTGAGGTTYSATGLSYYDSTSVPTSFDQVRFSNEASTTSARVLYVDNVSVVNTPPPNSAPVMVVANAGNSPVATNVSANYSFSATDAEGDPVQFEVDWGDGIVDAWSAPQAVTNPYVTSHHYISPGFYQISARVADFSNGGTSPVVIQTIVVANKSVTWSGAADGQWSTVVSDPIKNWLLTGDGTTQADFETCDITTFDNSSSVSNVAINGGDVFPGGVVFSNDASHPYAISGTNGINGAGTVAKSGIGILTLTNANSHTGGTLLNDGRLRIGNASAIGAGTLTASGGALSSDGTTARTLANAIVLTGTTTFGDATDNGALTLSGTISGSGGLTKAGPGPLTVSGANTYTGTTTISAGTLQFGTGGVTGTLSAAGTIVDNGTLAINRSDAVTQGIHFSTAGVSGSGTLTKMGSGTLTLNATNTYSGGTTISSGVLQADGSGAVGSGTVTIAGGVRLSVGAGVNLPNSIAIGANTGAQGAGLVQSSAGTATVSGPISITTAPAGGGHFAAAGTSVLNVTGIITSSVPVNSRTGNVVLSGGGSGYNSLVIGGGTVSPGVANGIATTAVVNVAVSNAGTLDLAGFNQQIAGLIRTGANTAVVTSSAGTPVLTLATAGTNSYTYSGAISGPLSLVKSGSGTQILSGANTYSGTTSINGGTLEIDGTATSAVAVGAGGTLAGGGTISGTVLSAAGSTIAPGPGTGTLSIGTATVGGTLAVDINGAASDKLAVSGDLAIQSDSALTVALSGGGFSQGSYVIAECTGTLTGTFTTVPAGYQVTYSGTQVILSQSGGGYAGWAATHAGGQTADNDYDHDGVPNGVEYFMGETGSSFTGSPVIDAGKVIWPRDPAADATYVVETSTDLSHWTTATSGVVEHEASIEFTAPATGTAFFTRLRVTVP